MAKYLILILILNEIYSIEMKVVYPKKRYDRNCSNLANSNSIKDRCEFYKCFEVRLLLK